MRKILTILFTISLGVLLVSCNKDNKTQIGILQFVEHNALTASKEGFIDALADAGYIDGENIKINLLNPNADDVVMQKQAKTLIRKNDLVLGIATPAAIALKTESVKQRNNKPILFTAVTDPVDAKLIESNLAPGANITGTNDLNPISEQISLAKELIPNIKKIGILYNSSEPNSSLQATEAKKVAENLDLEVIEKTFLNVSEIKPTAESLAKDVELIYTPTDNAIASSIGTLNLVSRDKKIPFIVGEDTLVSELPSLTIGINYYELGKITGEMAVEILKGKKPSEIPSVGLTNFNLAINIEALESIGIVVPKSLLERVEN